MLSFLGIKTKNFPEDIIQFQEKINKIANDLVKSNLDPEMREKNNKVDLLALQDAEQCHNSFIFLSNELEKVFNKISLDSLGQDVFIGRRKSSSKKKNQKNNNNNNYDKKEVCQKLALIYVRHFNLISAILTAINPENNMCYQRVKALYDETQGKVNLCDKSLYPDDVEELNGIKELLNLYYFYLVQDKVNPDEKARVEKEFQEFKGDLENYMIYSGIEAPANAFGQENNNMETSQNNNNNGNNTGNNGNNNSNGNNDNNNSNREKKLEEEIEKIKEEATQARDKAINNYANSITKEQAQRNNQINRKVSDLMEKIDGLSMLVQESKSENQNQEKLRDDIQKMIDENSRQQLNSVKDEISKLQEQIDSISKNQEPQEENNYQEPQDNQENNFQSTMPELPPIPDDVPPIEPLPTTSEDDFKLPPQMGGRKEENNNLENNNLEKNAYQIPEENERSSRNINQIENNQENENNQEVQPDDKTPVGRFVSFLSEYQKLKKIPEKLHLHLRPRKPTEIAGSNFCQLIEKPIDIDNKFYSEFKEIVNRAELHYHNQTEKLLELLNQYLVYHDKDEDKYQLANIGERELVKAEQKGRTLLSQYYLNCHKLYQEAFKALEMGILNHKKDMEVQAVEAKYDDNNNQINQYNSNNKK